MPLHTFELQAVENCDDLAACNHTELYQICKHIGVVAPPDATINELQNLITKEEVPAVNIINDIRDELMGLLLQHWKRVQSQLTCPAKSGNPKSCHLCVDAQVIHCLTLNPDAERNVMMLIRRKR